VAIDLLYFLPTMMPLDASARTAELVETLIGAIEKPKASR
jgi:hypothetical protein